MLGSLTPIEIDDFLGDRWVVNRMARSMLYRSVLSTQVDD